MSNKVLDSRPQKMKRNVFLKNGQSNNLPQIKYGISDPCGDLLQWNLSWAAVIQIKRGLGPGPELDNFLNYLFILCSTAWGPKSSAIATPSICSCDCGPFDYVIWFTLTIRHWWHADSTIISTRTSSATFFSAFFSLAIFLDETASLDYTTFSCHMNWWTF